MPHIILYIIYLQIFAFDFLNRIVSMNRTYDRLIDEKPGSKLAIMGSSFFV